MATFSNFNNRLPDPTFKVDDAGAVSSTGSAGPGFASVSVVSNRPAQVSRTNSGRGIHREAGSHTWEITINYHPMKRDKFDVVSTFLEFRNGRLKPFFVVLPQHSKPKDPAFATFAASNIIRVQGNFSAGSSSILMQTIPTITGKAKPGDFFTISDPNDANHMKAYKVVAVETNDTYKTGSSQPALNQMRVHIMPPLTKYVISQATVNWINPAFRVIQKADVLEYQLNTDNLYQFGLQLEEIQP